MILGVLGSAAEDSRSRLALHTVGELVRAHREPYDLLDLSLEFHHLQDLADYDHPDPSGQTAALRRRFAGASAVVLATPVYHGTYSGLLKNALDQLLSSAFEGRPVGLLANGGGPRGAAIACDQLRTVVRALNGWSAPTQVSTSAADFVDGRPVPAILDRLGDMVGELVGFLADRRQRQPQLSADALLHPTVLQTQGN
ncbi:MULTISPECIES: NADPH-dependent FMN reductase [Kitasatospora]|uniref:Putative flavin reductase n=1 Tax=Kitasatospora setae (strain ATCC 33774 / DSM 43861 / JCM 3304 / KCC A-0304 / NBRC 14216 / KM-6054) TaxID=452652 RepID=E4N0F8_KITSK|nr:NADPH-dependent FMN reductase [Kitasatospora setae]BAJ31642.1 putative flavin reductase [Kitasatospora setae KM-6054]